MNPVIVTVTEKSVAEGGVSFGTTRVKFGAPVSFTKEKVLLNPEGRPLEGTATFVLVGPDDPEKKKRGLVRVISEYVDLNGRKQIKYGHFDCRKWTQFKYWPWKTERDGLTVGKDIVTEKTLSDVLEESYNDPEVKAAIQKIKDKAKVDALARVRAARETAAK